jgi:RNA polymerase sigma-70 factor (ECF subfamily)
MGVLPWERSAVFRLAFVEGETYSDMAAHFDLPVDVMRAWVRQDLQILVEGLSQ